jgi:uncharacterized protein
MPHPLRIVTLALLLALAGCFSGTVPPSEIPPEASTIPDQPQVTATETPIYPLSINLLRERAFTGSDIVFEQTLEPGVNYSRYIVSYRSDGLKIYALMTIPQEPKPPSGYPVVIFNHGYIPPTEYRTTERYVAYVDAFARNGYIVLKSDYRGHGDSEGNPESVYGSPAYVIDVMNMLASARRYPDADGNRIGMWGHSMGGYITLRAMVVDRGIKAGVIWAGVVASYDEMFASWFGRRGGDWREELIEDYGSPQENPDFWRSLSANNYLSDLSGPMQLHHGTGDATVPYRYSTLLEEAIRTAGKPVELFLYQGDDHNISVNRDDALTLSVVFFNQWVKGSYG